MKDEKLAIFGGKPLLKKPLPAYNSLGQEETKAVLRVMRQKILSGFVGRSGTGFLGGRYVRSLERLFARKFKIKYAVSFNSASTALQAAVAALGIGPGDEVITSPWTMSATASAILLNNAIPVFADINADNFSLDERSIEERISTSTKAILVVNIFGGSSDFKNIIPLAKKYKLKIIEDNAQAIGARYGRRYLGTIGDIGVFSFNVHKQLQCGEGGILVSNNKHIAFRARLIRNHGEAVVDDLEIAEPIIGSNYRLGELEAVIAQEQLKKLDRLIQSRITLANYLTSKLRKFCWLVPARLLKNTNHSYYVYPFKFLEEKLGVSRATFVRAMQKEGFTLNEGYVKPLYLMPLYQKKQFYSHSQFPFVSKEFPSQVSYDKGICPVAEHLYEREFLFTTICQPPQTNKEIDLFVRALGKIEKQVNNLIAYEHRKY